MIITKCDKCHKEIEEQEGVSISVKNSLIQKYDFKQPSFEHFDLCLDCWSLTKKFIAVDLEGGD